MDSFRVAGASEYLAITDWGVDDVKLAKKAWVWLGQRCTTIDAVPASYELEAHGITADNFPVVLRAVCTVGPKTEYEVDPLLLRANAKLLAAPRRVRALAAGMTAEEISAKGAGGFAMDALESAQPDLGKYGLRVYSATVERLAVHVPAPANKVSIVTAPAAMGLSVQVERGAVSLSVATKKAGSCDDKQAAVQIKMAGTQSLMAEGQTMMAGAQSMMAGAQSMMAGGQSMMAGAQSMIAGGQSMMAGGQSMTAAAQSMMLTPAYLAGELPTEPSAR